MRTITEKRKVFMKKLTSVIDILDPSGDNSKLYHNLFDKMSDKEFDKYIKEFFEDEDQNLYLEIVEFERDLTLDNIFKCSEFMKVPLFENVCVPYLTYDMNNIPVTPEPVPVGYIHIKRMQQTILKKNSGSIEIKKRNPKTGQVTNEDKNARNTDVETFSMIALGAEKALSEFMGPKADNMKAKNEMNNQISKNGYTSLEELSNEPEDKVALNTLDVYFAMQGLRTNLVSPMDLFPSPKK